MHKFIFHQPLVCLGAGLSVLIPYLNTVGTAMLPQALGFVLELLVGYQLHVRGEAVS